MKKKRLGYLLSLALLLMVALQPFVAVTVFAEDGNGTLNGTAQDADKKPREPREDQFVQRDGSKLVLGDKPFRFGGTNNYYLEYSSQLMVDDALTTAAANHFNVMRMWGFLDIGSQDGTNSVDGSGKKNGIYFQYWDGTKPAYNDGPDGLQKLDYVIYKAGQLGIKLVIPFTNNWNAFGGMDQYVKWRGGQFHDQFYTDPIIQGWFKDWISHLLNRTNIYTGLKYKNDPTIMMWELANEPRCKSAGVYPPSSTCSTQNLTNWADKMSSYIKDKDSHHLVGTGDEGFYCTPGSTDWTENCGEGIDNVALSRLKNIDVVSMHLYPDSWGKDVAWSTNWIIRHVQEAKDHNKAFLLGEFGLQDQKIRNPVYKEWTEAVYNNGGNGFLFWMLGGKQDDGTYYPDYDGFTVYCPSPVCLNLTDHALMMAGKKGPFAPVADNDTVTSDFNTASSLNPVANDIAFGNATILPGTIDIDLATPGQQTSITTAQGTYVLNSDATVTFTPVAGFYGTSSVPYTVKDSQGQTSNAANLTAKVKPDPLAALQLYSFETGTEGWSFGNWQGSNGTVSQSTDFHTSGNYSLKADTITGGWFGLDINTPFNLGSRTHFKYDLTTGSSGTSLNVAFKVGDSFTWCQGSWGYLNSGTTTTVDIDLTGYSCGISQPFSAVHGIYIWFSGGSFYMDNIRAE